MDVAGSASLTAAKPLKCRIPLESYVVAECPHCGKPLPLCICDSVTLIESRVQLLILLHPQAQDKRSAIARLTAQHSINAVVRIGLSWPSLAKALGRPRADPSPLGRALSRLGQGRGARHRCRDRRHQPQGRARTESTHHPRPHRGHRAARRHLEPVKALWWRNPWMLKCQRVILGPKRPCATASCAANRVATACRPFEAAGDAAGRHLAAAGYRCDPDRQFRADAGAVPRGQSRYAGTGTEAEEAGLSSAQALAVRLPGRLVQSSGCTTFGR